MEGGIGLVWRPLVDNLRNETLATGGGGTIDMCSPVLEPGGNAAG